MAHHTSYMIHGDALCGAASVYQLTHLYPIQAFTRALKEQLEGELSARATHVESKSFKVIQQPQSKSKSKTSRGASDNAMNTETTT